MKDEPYNHWRSYQVAPDIQAQPVCGPVRVTRNSDKIRVCYKHLIGCIKGARIIRFSLLGEPTLRALFCVV